jgi:putative RNA 2'-phosphotransferase
MTIAIPRIPMTSKDKLTKTSKFLSFILRHQPDSIGLTLDDSGWADVDELLECARRHGTNIDRSLLDEVVATNEKQRFAFNGERTKIRASQGHSIAIDLALENIEPPEILYHGTATRFLKLIESQGLTRQSRQHVHLCAETETARNVGTRHGMPAILQIAAGKMHAAGFEFYLSDNGVWLVDRVPPQFITRV